MSRASIVGRKNRKKIGCGIFQHGESVSVRDHVAGIFGQGCAKIGQNGRTQTGGHETLELGKT